MDNGVLAYRRAIALQKIVAAADRVAERPGIDPKQAQRLRSFGDRAREMSSKPKDNLYALRLLESLAEMLETFASEEPPKISTEDPRPGE